MTKITNKNRKIKRFENEKIIRQPTDINTINMSSFMHLNPDAGII